MIYTYINIQWLSIFPILYLNFHVALRVNTDRVYKQLLPVDLF
jgi:hypothetical protein